MNKYFKLMNKPTRLYQIDDINLLVGTEGGKIEHWSFHENCCKKVYDAHPESDLGISAILELQTKSELLRGAPKEEDNFKLIATASEGAKEFRLWKLHMATAQLFPYLKIETTFTGGIKYLLETQDTQLAAANESQLKFYDFVDKREKDQKEKEKKDKATVNSQMKEIFAEVNVSGSNKLNKSDCQKYFQLLHEKIQGAGDNFYYASHCTPECLEEVWYEFDINETGSVSWHVMKPMIERIVEHDRFMREEKRLFDEKQKRRRDEHDRKVAERIEKIAQMEREYEEQQEAENMDNFE